jgi:hypothetical protein
MDRRRRFASRSSRLAQERGQQRGVKRGNMSGWIIAPRAAISEPWSCPTIIAVVP